MPHKKPDAIEAKSVDAGAEGDVSGNEILERVKVEKADADDPGDKGDIKDAPDVLPVRLAVCPLYL
jgi:hypothetical protein